jgi:hypothetical protein
MYVTELETLREKRKNPLQDPPVYQIEKKSVQEEVQIVSIPEDEIHVSIRSVNGLEHLEGKDTFVKFCLNFPSQSPHEGKTNVFNLTREKVTAIPAGDGNFRFKLPRSRGTQKLFELKKVVVEVWRPGGFLKNPEMIARGYQELVSSEADLISFSQE